MVNGEYQLRVIFHECEWTGNAYGADGDHAMRFYNNVCPRCGQKYDHYDLGNFRVAVMQWKSESVWWNPLSWGRGRWIEKGS